MFNTTSGHFKQHTHARVGCDVRRCCRAVFEKTVELFRKIGGHLGTPGIEAFLFLAIILYAAISSFRKLLNSIFRMKSGRAAA